MVHTIRFYPARTAGGAVIPNTWIVAHDKFAEGNIGAVNYDYQDEVFVMTNAQPEHPQAAPAPGSAGHSLDFSSSGGTVVDSAGRGTGFTSVMANSAGTQHDPSRVTLDTGAGVLRIRSTSGTASTSSNNQKNALQVAFDGTRDPVRVSTRFLGPLPLTQASQHIGIYVGPGQDGFMKLEVEFRGGECAIVLYREGSGAGGGLRGSRGIGPCNAISSVDLELTGDPATASFEAAYRVNGGTRTNVFTSEDHITYDPMGFFSRQARAGIIVSNQATGGQTPPEFTATFDSFSVAAA
jgi:hypothetical protein